MNRSAASRGEQQRRFGFSVRRWAVLRGFAAAGMMGENDLLFRVVNQRTLNISLFIQIKTPQKARSALEITQGYLQYLAICGVWLDLPAVAQIRIVAAAGRSQLQETGVGTYRPVERTPGLMRICLAQPLFCPGLASSCPSFDGVYWPV